MVLLHSSKLMHAMRNNSKIADILKDARDEELKVHLPSSACDRSPRIPALSITVLPPDT